MVKLPGFLMKKMTSKKNHLLKRWLYIALAGIFKAPAIWYNSALFDEICRI